MDFDSMKYADLQSLAKGLGLKANMKTEKLLKAIKQHYEQKAEKSQAPETQPAAVEEDENASMAQTSTETSAKQENFNPPVFVNTRRGKKIGGKRKISDVAAVNECDVHGPGSAGAERLAPGKLRLLQPVVPELGKRGKCPLPGTLTARSSLKSGTKRPSLLMRKKNQKWLNLTRSLVSKRNTALPILRNFTKHILTRWNPSIPTSNGGQEIWTRTEIPQKNSKQQTSRAAEERRRHTTLPAAKAPPNKPAGKDDAAFRPSVFSTRRLNIRFSEATGDNENKRPVVKTPGRMSSCVASSTPLKQASDAGKRKTAVFSATKTPGPFVFTGNASCVSTPGTQKPKFDLKASLSRPLTYKPHTGKLKPFGDAKENPSANKSLVSVGTRQKNYKQHQAKTREDRRAEQAKDRRQKKEGVLGARRGLVMM
ncbi:unnamed protein product, partial [Tetraodon nigroviridis]